MTLIPTRSRLAVAFLAALLMVPSLASAALERFGPVVPEHGYPLWYQDSTGVTLEFCQPTNQAELDGGHCLLLPGDTVVPEVFPNAFADAHFYWAADAIGEWQFGNQSDDARLILGLEAAFATGPVIPGEQIVFGRIRIRIDNIPLSGTYTIYTPYGRYVFENQVAGDRIFYTEDIGLSCNLGDFSCALQSNLGPFLLPSETPGGAELPPVEGPVPGKLYIADPARDGPVTGSPIQGDYQTSSGPRNPNIFRVEGPGGVVLFETFDFALMGRLYQGPIPAQLRVDRASYARDASNRQVDVFVTAFPNVEPRLPAQPIVPPVVPLLSLFTAPCGEESAPGGAVRYLAPEAPSVAMARNGEVYWAQTQPADIPTGVCVSHDNAVSGGQTAPAYFLAPLHDQVFITTATYDAGSGSLLVEASSSDQVTNPVLTIGAFGDVPSTDLDENGQGAIVTAAPPAKVRIRSTEGGTNEMQVTVTAGAVLNQAPIAVADVASTVQNEAVVIDVLGNDSDPDGDTLTITAVTQPANGSVVITSGGVTYTPATAFTGNDAFTYTISDGKNAFATAAVSVIVSAAANAPPVANSDTAITSLNTPVVIQVLANDGDPNGDPLTVTSVTAPTSGTATTNGTTVTYTPATDFSGTATFSYTVSDGRGGTASATVTVTVRAAETLTVTLAQFRAPSEWRVSGTSTVEGATVTIHAGPDLTGQVIGTAQVAGGVWTFRSSTTGVAATNRISVVSTGGGQRLNVAVTIR